MTTKLIEELLPEPLKKKNLQLYFQNFEQYVKKGTLIKIGKTSHKKADFIRKLENEVNICFDKHPEAEIHCIKPEGHTDSHHNIFTKTTW